MQTPTDKPLDAEAQALAACYRLLLEMAREREERFARMTDGRERQQPRRNGAAAGHDESRRED